MVVRPMIGVFSRFSSDLVNALPASIGMRFPPLASIRKEIALSFYPATTIPLLNGVKKRVCVSEAQLRNICQK